LHSKTRRDQDPCASHSRGDGTKQWPQWGLFDLTAGQSVAPFGLNRFQAIEHQKLRLNVANNFEQVIQSSAFVGAFCEIPFATEVLVTRAWSTASPEEMSVPSGTSLRIRGAYTDHPPTYCTTFEPVDRGGREPITSPDGAITAGKACNFIEARYELVFSIIWT
jgi:hypothetical protein